MKHLILFSGFLFFSFCAVSQTAQCGTKMTKETLELLKKTEDSLKLKSKTGRILSGTTYFMVQHHIVRKSNGREGLSSDVLPKIIEDMNKAFLGSDIQFYSCRDINYIDSDTYYDFNRTQQRNLSSAHNVADAINIYYFNSILHPDGTACGYAPYPSDTSNFIAINNGGNKNCKPIGPLTIHEMGHFFGLPHTHLDKWSPSEEEERVDGSNCKTAADRFCDTPADPNLWDSILAIPKVDVDKNCKYTHTYLEADENGDRYSPNTANHMSYSPGECRSEFSNEQLAKAKVWATNSPKLKAFVNKNFPSTTEINDKTITSDKTFSDDIITIDNVTIENNSFVSIYSCKSVMIKKNFEVKAGSILQIQPYQIE